MGRKNARIRNDKKGRKDLVVKSCKLGVHKSWRKGESCISNPTKKKFRDEANKKFFLHTESLPHIKLTEDNLNKFNEDTDGTSRLVDDDDMRSVSSFQSWASSWTNCTTAQFNNVFRVWHKNSSLQKIILSLLSTFNEIYEKEYGKNEDMDLDDEKIGKRKDIYYFCIIFNHIDYLLNEISEVNRKNKRTNSTCEIEEKMEDGGEIVDEQQLHFDIGDHKRRIIEINSHMTGCLYLLKELIRFIEPKIISYQYERLMPILKKILIQFSNNFDEKISNDQQVLISSTLLISTWMMKKKNHHTPCLNQEYDKEFLRILLKFIYHPLDHIRRNLYRSIQRLLNGENEVLSKFTILILIDDFDILIKEEEKKTLKNLSQLLFFIKKIISIINNSDQSILCEKIIIRLLLCSIVGLKMDCLKILLEITRRSHKKSFDDENKRIGVHRSLIINILQLTMTLIEKNNQQNNNDDTILLYFCIVMHSMKRLAEIHILDPLSEDCLRILLKNYQKSISIIFQSIKRIGKNLHIILNGILLHVFHPINQSNISINPIIEQHLKEIGEQLNIFNPIENDGIIIHFIGNYISLFNKQQLDQFANYLDMIIRKIILLCCMCESKKTGEFKTAEKEKKKFVSAQQLSKFCEYALMRCIRNHSPSIIISRLKEFLPYVQIGGNDDGTISLETKPFIGQTMKNEFSCEKMKFSWLLPLIRVAYERQIKMLKVHEGQMEFSQFFNIWEVIIEKYSTIQSQLKMENDIEVFTILQTLKLQIWDLFQFYCKFGMIKNEFVDEYRKHLTDIGKYLSDENLDEEILIRIVRGLKCLLLEKNNGEVTKLFSNKLAIKFLQVLMNLFIDSNHKNYFNLFRDTIILLLCKFDEWNSKDMSSITTKLLDSFKNGISAKDGINENTWNIVDMFSFLLPRLSNGDVTEVLTFFHEMMMKENMKNQKKIMRFLPRRLFRLLFEHLSDENRLISINTDEDKNDKSEMNSDDDDDDDDNDMNIINLLKYSKIESIKLKTYSDNPHPLPDVYRIYIDSIPLLQNAFTSTNIYRLKFLNILIRYIPTVISQSKNEIEIKNNFRQFISLVHGEILVMLNCPNSSGVFLAYRTIIEMTKTIFKSNLYDESDHTNLGEQVINYLKRFIFVNCLTMESSPLLTQTSILALTRVIYEYRLDFFENEKNFLKDNCFPIILLMLNNMNRDIATPSIYCLRVILMEILEMKKTKNLPKFSDFILSKVCESLMKLSSDMRCFLRHKIKSLLQFIVRRGYGEWIRVKVSKDEHLTKQLKYVMKRQKKITKENDGKSGKSLMEVGSTTGSETKSFASLKTIEKAIDDIEESDDDEIETHKNSKKSTWSQRRQRWKEREQRNIWLIDEEENEDVEDPINFLDFEAVAARIFRKTSNDKKMEEQNTENDDDDDDDIDIFEDEETGKLIIGKNNSTNNKTKLMESTNHLNQKKQLTISGEKDNYFDDDDDNDDEQDMMLNDMKSTWTSNTNKRKDQLKEHLERERLKKLEKQKAFENKVMKNVELGTKFKGKKGKGDVKRSGDSEPYAYIPMQKSLLNRRKRSKYEGIVKRVMKKNPIIKKK
ncbi:hypothetical protein SNEBB_003054 [Seison nebaliae]|nr:hypothetical protein SNEBB_003054 [Seison nebaliae]